MNPAVSLNALWFRYAPEAPDVLHEISLDIAAHQVTALLGPNGSGKTTLLHLILGLLSPERGQVLLEGQPHETYTHRDLSQVVGLVPQDEPLAFNISVLEYVLLGRAPYLRLLQRPSTHDRQVALRALEATGIVELWARSVLTLSGGERQLATLARALAQKPRILLLDEPTSHLDVGNARRIMDIIERLRTNGQTVVFTTHDPNAAAAAADHVILMRQGRVLDAGPTVATLSADNLSATYDVPIQVRQDGDARPLVVVY